VLQRKTNQEKGKELCQLMKFYCPIIDEDADKGGFEGYGTGYDPYHVFGPVHLFFHVLWCCKYDVRETVRLTRQAKRVTRDAIIAKTARVFIHANWQGYLDCRDSDSMSVDVEFLNMGRAVEAIYGPPQHETK
jgi:hypothetical protein